MAETHPVYLDPVGLIDDRTRMLLFHVAIIIVQLFRAPVKCL